MAKRLLNTTDEERIAQVRSMLRSGNPARRDEARLLMGFERRVGHGPAKGKTTRPITPMRLRVDCRRDSCNLPRIDRDGRCAEHSR